MNKSTKEDKRCRSNVAIAMSINIESQKIKLSDNDKYVIRQALMDCGYYGTELKMADCKGNLRLHGYVRLPRKRN